MAAAAGGCRSEGGEDATAAAAALLYDGRIVYGVGRLQGFLFWRVAELGGGGGGGGRRMREIKGKLREGDAEWERKGDDEREKKKLRDGHLENEAKKVIDLIEKGS